jgi:hypothetical protein
MVKSGSSYLSQSEFPLTFGLGKPARATPVRLEIVWPRGAKQTVDGIQANQFVTIREGQGVLSSDPIRFGGSSPKQ